MYQRLRSKFSVKNTGSTVVYGSVVPVIFSYAESNSYAEHKSTGVNGQLIFIHIYVFIRLTEQYLIVRLTGRQLTVDGIEQYVDGGQVDSWQLTVDGIEQYLSTVDRSTVDSRQ